jgi:uncharacterized delta-60 repeat protein
VGVATAGATVQYQMNLYVARVTSTGALDLTFSPTGFIALTNSVPAGATPQVSKVLLTQGGDLIVVGSIKDVNGKTDMAVWKIRGSDGAIDTTFNGTGVFFHDNAALGLGDDIGEGGALDPTSGKILVTGCSTHPFGGSEMVVWRLNTDGTLDSSFSSTGFLTTNELDRSECGKAMAFDSNGRMIVTGRSNLVGSSDQDLKIWVFTP